MKKEILFSSQAQRDYKKLSKETKRRIKASLKKLASGIKHLDIKKLKGIEGREDLFRLRIGDYRIVYYPQKTVIKVIRIDRRSKIYEWLE
ncbi:MAG: type II toxin-antitoxin system RelE/ParE family toxin [Thermoplasmata archaeon]|nr:MAG: type II toxin-antitoxin system RelE/ParE family toxin [Thermoplasmata archaeon]